ncbi:MAG: PAS domain-containing protein [Theionarchaea archaeon]|nr:PAS domain-containing protein [Theionarchaea archaeon]MBU7020404.1 PAS domain-containing protein [Theionarchaea archaeon]
MDDNGLGPGEAREASEFEFLEGIPAGAYEVDREGNFLYCNQEAAHLLGYDSAEELSQRNIYDLYFDRKDREKVLERTKTLGGRMKSYIRWRRKNGSEVVVNDFAEFVYDNCGVESGIRGIFVEATYERLFDDLNAGIYRVGPDDKTIELVNKAVARIFGFDSPEKMRGLDISKLYRHTKDYQKFMEDLKDNERVENYPLEMKRADGEPIIISVSCHVLRDEQGKVVGREGTFTDVTEQQRYRELLEIPLGVYEAKLKGGKPIIIFCNEKFVEMFGYSSESELTGMNIHELYANEKDVWQFEKALKEADEENRPLDYLLKVKRKVTGKEGKEREEFWIKIYCYPREDEEGNIIGRIGTVMDVTDRMELERIIETRKDIQRFIHGFIAPMMSIHATSQVVAREVERGVGIKYGLEDMVRLQKKKRNTMHLFEEMKTVSESLAQKIKDLVELCRVEPAFDKNHIQELATIKENVEKEIEDIVRRIIEVRKLHKDAHGELNNVLAFIRTERRIENSRGITGLIKSCFIDLDELDSTYLLYLTQSILNKSKIAYHDVEGLRQLMMRVGDENAEQLFEFQPTTLEDMIEDTIDMYRIDASLKGISIRSPRGKIPEVDVSRSHMERLLSYVIQNAVKYSFKRDGYIHVDLRVRGEHVQIDVEDYGVGILHEEIESGKIFEYGYRGKFSRDRNRTGSGIGLSEAKRISEAHGGHIRVESIPVGDLEEEITHNTPHKTTISIILPIKQKKGDQNG